MISLSLFLSLSLSRLRRKQPKYPVLFLTTNLIPKYGVPFDVREQTIYDAMMHAKTEKLLVSIPRHTTIISESLVVVAGHAFTHTY